MISGPRAHATEKKQIQDFKAQQFNSELMLSSASTPTALEGFLNCAEHRGERPSRSPCQLALEETGRVVYRVTGSLSETNSEGSILAASVLEVIFHRYKPRVTQKRRERKGSPCSRLWFPECLQDHLSSSPSYKRWTHPASSRDHHLSSNWWKIGCCQEITDFPPITGGPGLCSCGGLWVGSRC